MPLYSYGCLTNSGAVCSSKGRVKASRWPRTSSRSSVQLRLTRTSRYPKVSVRKSAPRWNTMHSAGSAPPTRVPRRLLLVQAAQNAVAFCKCEANPGLLTFRNFCSVTLCDGWWGCKYECLLKYSPWLRGGGGERKVSGTPCAVFNLFRQRSTKYGSVIPKVRANFGEEAELSCRRHRQDEWGREGSGGGRGGHTCPHVCCYI